MMKDPGGGNACLSATARWSALGGSPGAPQQFVEGCRWTGDKTVEIDNNLIRQCTDGSEGGKITDLNFHFKFVQRIHSLEPHSAHLRCLDLSSNNIRHIEGLGAMPKLRELKLYSCQIQRIQNLDKCVCLGSLHLEDNCIGAIEGLDNLRQLEHLSLDSNRVQRLGRGLAKLSKLRELRLSRNQLSSLDGLAGLSSLELLWVDHNQLQQVTAEQVKGLGKLDELQIGGNQIRSLSFLAAGSNGTQPSMPSLTSLDASDNALTAKTLKGLPPLLQLAELNLARNQIEEVPEGLPDAWPTLEILDISSNSLDKAEDLQRLRHISSLKELLVHGNPIANALNGEDGVRQALAGLDALEYLDDRQLPPAAVVAEASEAAALPRTEDNGNGVGSSLAPRREESLIGTARPGTGSRPSTGSSRPSTTQSLREAGVQQPLMHAQLKLSQNRFVGEEQVLQWEKQTLSGLKAIDKQMQKTSGQVDSELEAMSRYLRKADEVLQRERARIGRRPASPGEEAAEEAAQLQPRLLAPPEPRKPSRLSRRLHAAVELAAVSEEPTEENLRSPANSASPGCASLAQRVGGSEAQSPPAVQLPALCDEEVEEECAQDVHSIAPSPEPSDVGVDEVDDEELPEVENSAVVPTQAIVGGDATGRFPGAEPLELRVDARAEKRMQQKSRKRPSGLPRSPQC